MSECITADCNVSEASELSKSSSGEEDLPQSDLILAKAAIGEEVAYAGDSLIMEYILSEVCIFLSFLVLH